MITDRPDFTEASSVVGLGILQIETGYTYFYDDDGTTQTISHSYPEALLRYGVLANWLEFRLAANYGNSDVNGLSSDGTDDLYLGLKIGLTPQEGLLPEMALIPQMTVPTGGSATTNGEVLAGLNWLYGWDINDFLATGGSTQFNRSLDEATGMGFTQWAQSWTIAYSLADRLGAYTEYYGFYPSGADTASPEHYFNGGFTFLVSNDVQWDIRGGTGLNDEADDYFVGTGLSLRFR
ncbi:transporter [Novipirellula herctigrandis]|uniref:transporter n=1 Tax=Novipirellula herctigrandis TaxID=2527986 RepID=UPI003AF3C5EF